MFNEDRIKDLEIKVEVLKLNGKYPLWEGEDPRFQPTLNAIEIIERFEEIYDYLNVQRIGIERPRRATLVKKK